MSKYTAKRSINNSFKQQLVSNYLLRREHEKLEIYSKAQFIAMEEGDLEEVAKIEKKIKKLILV